MQTIRDRLLELEKQLRNQGNSGLPADWRLVLQWALEVKEISRLLSGFDGLPEKWANGCKTCLNNHDPGIPCRYV